MSVDSQNDKLSPLAYLIICMTKLELKSIVNLLQLYMLNTICLLKTATVTNQFFVGTYKYLSQFKINLPKLK